MTIIRITSILDVVTRGDVIQIKIALTDAGYSAVVYIDNNIFTLETKVLIETDAPKGKAHEILRNKFHKQAKIEIWEET